MQSLDDKQILVEMTLTSRPPRTGCPARRGRDRVVAGAGRGRDQVLAYPSDAAVKLRTDLDQKGFAGRHFPEGEADHRKVNATARTAILPIYHQASGCDRLQPAIVVGPDQSGPEDLPRSGMQTSAAVSGLPSSMGRGDDRPTGLERSNHPMCTPAGYIEINRRFSRLHSSDGREELASSSYLGYSFADSESLGWDELLKERLVVVLGEPGSGKSWEFRSRCSSLQKDGEFAFLIELERLVSGAFASVFAPADHERFQQWQRGRRTAYFFLDSVDEAKIRRQSDFYAALDKVMTAVGPAVMDRARVFISSRISEWQPETDRHEVLSRFGAAGTRHPRARTETEAAVLIVQIDPLDRARVRAFAESREIGNPDQFLAELDNHSAWEFARRPVDVLDLAEFWKAKGRLGSLTEIIEHDVTTKLKETTQRHATFPLSEARAREGAEALAVATILCKRQQFKVPDDNFVASDALNATSCLPADWKPGEVAALLSRPLFDSATYGQIRFHHRRVSEYLAAQWIGTRMSEGCPTRVLFQLLFDDARRTPVPRRTLIPVTAWLCSGNERWNAEVRNWVLEGAPEIHLEYGDAEALPLEFKRSLLTAWIDRNRGREQVWSRYSPDAMRRLADQRLAPDVASFLGNNATPGEIRELLVQFVRYGSMTQCLPDLLAILGNPAECEDLKAYVLAALRDIGTPESHRQAWDILRAAPAITNAMRSLACDTLYPNTIGPADIALLLEKPSPRKEHPGSLQHAIERLLEERLPAEHAGALLGELNRLLQLAPHILMSRKETRISSRFEFLLEIFPLVLTRLLSSASLMEADCRSAAESLSLLAESHAFHRPHNDYSKSLDSATLAHPGVRRCFFWQSVDRWRAEHANDANYFFVRYEFHKVLQRTASDLDWMITDLETSPDRADRLLTLHVAIRLMERGDRRMVRLQRAVSADPELAAVLHAARSDARWAWLRRLRYRLSDTDKWKHWWFRKRLAIARIWTACRDRWWLFRNHGRLRSGRAIGVLAHLCHEAAKDESRFAPANWNALAEQRGTRIAEAVKEGCKRAWRDYSPSLPHEKTNPSEIDGRLIVGLAGIQSLIVDGELPFDSVSDAEVRLITRYAVQEMNGFPTWFQDLAAARPCPVAEVLTASVLGEWQYPAVRERFNDVLSGLAWEGGRLAQLVRPTVIDKLRAGDPAHPAIRDCAVSLVVKTATLPDDELATMAAARCRDLPVDSDAFSTWSAVCLQVNADQAITIIEERLRDCPEADAVVLGICEMLQGEIRPRLPFVGHPDYHKPSSLMRLIPLVYRHVRPEDDIDRAGGGAYTPTARDNASRFRNGLLDRLAQSGDPAATASLRTLLGRDELATHRDWILHLLDERIVRDADYVAWDPAAIRVFTHEYETDPRTDAELFRIILNRLTDIKNDVERSDNSLREEVQRGATEYVLRRWLARKLRERSRQRYTIPQEEEIDQEERPDLRAESPNTDPVSIELKWADNWTLPRLLERLEHQLVGQYLRAERSRYGIYVLGMDGRKGHWESLGGNLTFHQVIEQIVRRAEELKTSHHDIGDLRVVAIDFTLPT